MKVTAGLISVEEAELHEIEEREWQAAQAVSEQKMKEIAETTYFTMCKNEKRDCSQMYALRDRVAGVITGNYIMEFTNQRHYYSYQDAKTDLEVRKHESLCLNENRAWEEILDTYNNDKCINNMIYFDFILYLEERQGTFYTSISDNDYRAICSCKKNHSLPCLHTWSKHHFDTRKKGEEYINTDDSQSGRHICATKNYLPIIDKCLQKKWRPLFISGNIQKRTHFNYYSFFEPFLAVDEEKNKKSWGDIYVLESFTGFLLSENLYHYFFPYLMEVDTSNEFKKILDVYVTELSKIKHPFLRLYAFEMTKIPYSSPKELEMKFSIQEDKRTDRDFIITVIQKINQTYNSKWKDSLRRIKYHLNEDWNDNLSGADEKKRSPSCDRERL